MALTPEQIQKINEEFNKLISQLDNVDQRSLRDVKQRLDDGKLSLVEWNREVKRFQQSLDTITSDLDFVAQSFKDSVNELSRQNNYLNDAKRITRNIANTAYETAAVRRGENSLNEKATKQALERLNVQRKQLMVARQNFAIGSKERNEIDNIISQLNKYQTGLEGVLETNKEINRELGFAPQLAGGIDKALQKIGFPSLGISDALDTTRKLKQQAASTNKTFDVLSSFTKQVAANLKESFTATNITQIAFGVILKRVLEINKTQTEFRRLTGETATNFNNLNDSLISANDQLKTMVGLTEQFGFNANVAFDAINIQEATELRDLMGLSAEEAGNLAFFAQASGTNLKEAAANIYEGVDGALSQKKILQDVGKVSNSIAMTFGGNLELMGRTANEAKRLGLNLEQVDKIAEGLLDIENSIRAEFEAEVVSGKQLNLERARFFALTNDLNGLTKEIASNQEIINTFAKGDRIEQQAIAEALGLSRDEVSKMIFDQAILNQLTTEEAARRAGMTIEDAKRLTVQQSFNKSIEKMAELLAPTLEGFANLISNAVVLKGLMTAIAITTTVGFAKSLGSALISIAAMIPRAATLLGLTSAKAVAEVTAASALTLGLSTIGIVAGIATIVGYMKSAASDAQAVADGIAPASKGPFTITDSYGATAVTARGDSLAVSPNITREGRNAPSTMQLDYDRLADAIAKGAETGTSRARLTARVDNRQFAANQQTSQVIEQYRFSS